MSIPGFNNVALPALGTVPVNVPNDPAQVSMAFTGLLQQLSSWSRHVADTLNVLYQSGTITNGMLLIGDATNKVFDIATLTAGTNVTIVNGAGSITLSVSGAIPPSPGTSGGIPYYSSTTTLASSALLAANAIVVGGGAGTAPFTQSQWTITTSPQILENNANAAAIPAAISGSAGTQQVVQQADATVNKNSQIAYAATCTNIGWRAENTGASPNATAAGVSVQRLSARGFDGTNWTSNDIANVTFATINQTSGADHSSTVQVYTTPTGSPTLDTTPALDVRSQGVRVLGTNTNDSAAAGFVGEYGSSIVLVASEVSVATATTVNITSITPAAGDYEFWGEAWFDTSTGAATGITRVAAGIGTSNAILPFAPGDGTSRIDIDGIASLASSTGIPILSLSPCRISTTGTTTVYLMVRSIYTGGTLNAYGKLAWRRRR